MYSTTALQRVKSFIDQFPDLKVVLFESSTHTSAMAADTLGVEVAQIAKSLVFTADEKPLLVVTCGDRKVDTKKLRNHLNAKKVRFASAELVYELTGFPPGGVSPVGLEKLLPVFLDASLFNYPVVYAAAGTSNSALPIPPTRLQEITGAQLVDVC